MAEDDIKKRFGPAYRSNPEAKALADLAYSQLNLADVIRDKEFLTPHLAAALALATTAAPTIAAVMFKVELVKWEELHLYTDGLFECVDSVIEDAERLAA